MSYDEFNKECERKLVQYKRRNKKAVTRHLKGVREMLRHEDGHAVQTRFGGSVQKGTYVTGLSDVDVLLIVNRSSLKNQSPSKAVAYVRDSIRRRLPNNPVRAGRLAVAVSYADRTELQILPAIRTKDGFRIADPGSGWWSAVAHPERFAARLIEVNNARGGRVVPTIKLAKAMADRHISHSNRKIKLIRGRSHTYKKRRDMKRKIVVVVLVVAVLVPATLWAQVEEWPSEKLSETVANLVSRIEVLEGLYKPAPLIDSEGNCLLARESGLHPTTTAAYMGLSNNQLPDYVRVTAVHRVGDDEGDIAITFSIGLDDVYVTEFHEYIGCGYDGHSKFWTEDSDGNRTVIE